MSLFPKDPLSEDGQKLKTMILGLKQPFSARILTISGKLGWKIIIWEKGPKCIEKDISKH